MSTVFLTGYINEEDEEKVTIEIDVDDVLDELDDYDIKEYALTDLDMVESLDDFEDELLKEELEKRGFKIADEQNQPIEELYYPDNVYLEEIISKFYSLSVFDREKLYKQIINL